MTYPASHPANFAHLLIIAYPRGRVYHVSYGGAYEEQTKTFSELMLILLTAVVLVFAVILFLFIDVKISFLIIFISVLGITRSLIALFITVTPLNVGSYTGIIMIIGIISENVIFTFL